MTDASLAHRAEQALLGAMITQPGRAAALPATVTAGDFADPCHQAIFAALTGTAGEEHGVLRRLRGLLTWFSRRTRDTKDYMESLPGMCPDAGHLDAYYEMISAAGTQRAAAATAAVTGRGIEMLAGAAMHLAGQAAGAGKTPAGETGLPADVARLARTLGTLAPLHAQRPGDAWQQGQTRRAPAAVAAEAGQGRGEARPAPAGDGESPDRRDRPAGASHAGRPEDVQDAVLASLLRHSGEAGEVTVWLSAEAFSQGPRRDLYEMITAAIAGGKSVDPLIMAWTAAERLSAGPEPAAGAAGDSSACPEFILTVADIDTGPGTAAVLGRGLLADYVCTARFGADWPRSPQLTRPAARPAVAPGTPGAAQPDGTRAIAAPSQNGARPERQVQPAAAAREAAGTLVPSGNPPATAGTVSGPGVQPPPGAVPGYDGNSRTPVL
jgi:DnaB-like helicase N terminal domain